MRERVALYGGTFEAGRIRPRGFRLYAAFPLSEPVPAAASPNRFGARRAAKGLA
jgi:hypothetical protein